MSIEANSVKIICDSISPQDHRLTTFELRYPKFIHGEFLTHRLFSRNASSSRAIPTAKYIEEARLDGLRATPVFWGKNQKGMSATEELTGDQLLGAQFEWRQAALDAANRAVLLLNQGAHKQIVNRILEPFLHINVVMTSCEPGLMNFFGLRLDAGAQPEMRALAEAMWTKYREGEPTPLKPGEWHLPYVDWRQFMAVERNLIPDNEMTIDKHLQIAIRVSVARCARVSYKSFETGKVSTVEEDLKLYDRLIGTQPIHASPAEHQASPDTDVRLVEHRSRVSGRDNFEEWSEWAGDHKYQWGNFIGWRQYRKTLPGEACAPLPEGYHAAEGKP